MCDDHTYPNNFSNVLELETSDENVNDVGEFVDTLDELIIACVQSYTHLYKKNEKNYKDQLMKESSWEEIARTCHVSSMYIKWFCM